MKNGTEVVVVFLLIVLETGIIQNFAFACSPLYHFPLLSMCIGLVHSLYFLDFARLFFGHSILAVI